MEIDYSERHVYRKSLCKVQNSGNASTSANDQSQKTCWDNTPPVRLGNSRVIRQGGTWCYEDS